ncbi:(d)CMP kinase [Wenyingzhuangia marina]|uniref:Cytidylate kinase n=1 Tax=Wenyingzhuangia marina TaxID=1195760 RepID=A0A1M5W699_9FLAO|nr:(d)CMP kinase [Wenyingzhuangia marina]GGF75578.1 cytidylate kinase [Wenyingzhuangia marina]SHH82958.1 cytidylate kinase [Wenyingzhuangia marina]
MTSKITIAIDGFSSTGKSTVAKQLAKELGYIYVDTGAMYRAVALYAIQNNYINEGDINVEKLIESLDKINIDFKYNAQLGFSEVYLNGVNVETEIRGMEVSSYVSKVASISAVRQKLVALQQEMGKAKGIVMDGRDIGTVVFPNAELKLFMTASAETRAQRRFDELQAKGNTEVSYKEVYNNVVERDTLDTTRTDSPLEIAKDAIEIDNSNLSREEQFNKILSLVNAKL